MDFVDLDNTKLEFRLEMFGVESKISDQNSNLALAKPLKYITKFLITRCSSVITNQDLASGNFAILDCAYKVVGMFWLHEGL